MEAPCKTVDGFFSMVCGLTWLKLRALVQVYDMDGSLLRTLDAAKAEANGKEFGQGTRTDLSEHRAVRTMLGRGSDNEAHLLRRLARTSPETLAAYESGKITSAAAAARAAGIPIGERVFLGKPRTVAARIVAKGEDYAREVLTNVGQ